MKNISEYKDRGVPVEADVKENVSADNNEECYFLEPDNTFSGDVFPDIENRKYVPHLQTMDEYIKLHYSKSIARLVYQWVNLGKVTIESEKKPKALINTVTLGKMRYWRVNRSVVIVDIRLSVCVEVVRDGEYGIEENFYYAELAFGMDENPKYMQGTFSLSEDEPEHTDHWPLSEYLIPYIKKEDIEEFAEDLLDYWVPGYQTEDDCNRLYRLAGILGLTVKRYQLYGKKHTRSILFFKRNTACVDR